jgi:hypothetical protein
MGETAFSVGRREREKMNNIMLIISALVLVLAASKKSYVFQQTLLGSNAVEWLKPGVEVIAEKMTFGLGTALFDLGWNIQEWNLEKNCVLIFHKGGMMPLLVSSRDVVNFFAVVANAWLDAEAEVISQGKNEDQTDTIGRPDGVKELLYKIDRGEGKFDPYYVVVDEV